MKLKESIARFRAWQKAPHRYSDQDLETHCCANCGHEFEGNYCPICGQSGDDGKITWRSVGNSFVSIWNLESRSLPSSIWQLIWRPGYFISEYINGHKQVCHPPANMLFTVAVIYLLLTQIFGLNPEIHLSKETNMHTFELVINWLSQHPAWNMITLTMCMILPTWALFRFAPRNNRHTLPESIFIQLILSTLLLTCSFFANLSAWFYVLIPFYYIVTYRQLFGYSFWGTLWRLSLCGLIWINILFFFIFLLLLSDNFLLSDEYSRYYSISMLLSSVILLTIAIILLFIGYFISKRRSQKYNN